MEFVDVVAGAVDDELTDVLIPQGEREAAGVALVGEIEALIIEAGVILIIYGGVVGICGAIEKVDGLIVALEAASVVVDNVEGYGDAVKVAEVDQAFQLRGGGSDVGGGERREIFGGQQAIDGDQVIGEGWLACGYVRKVRREV